MKKKFLLSIITPTLNTQKDLRLFLELINRQDKRGFDLEIIVVDGGSKDNTVKIAKKMGAIVIKNTYVLADPGVNLGIKKAKGDLIMILAVDNIFESDDALLKIVNTFKDKSIYAAFPKHTSSIRDTIYSKYINTFTDPPNHFVYGYASNPRTFQKVYKVLKKNNEYTLFDFKSSELIPLIAFAQGFTFRRGFHRKETDSFDDTTPVIELIKKNNKIAYLHSVNMYHHTISSFFQFVRKQAWKTNNYLKKKNYGMSHRVALLSKTQTDRIFLWPLYSLTIIPPFIYALYHLFKDRELMWIFHPFLCIISGYTSLYTLLNFYLNKENELHYS